VSCQHDAQRIFERNQHKADSAFSLLHVGFFLDLFFDSEEGRGVILRIVVDFQPTPRQSSWQTSLWEPRILYNVLLLQELC
jgi:hypothetical protein